MSRLKDETLSIRTSAEIKQLLRLAADRERRSVASMIEILVLDSCRRWQTNARPSTSTSRTANSVARSTVRRMGSFAR
ncbi:hypothetical protein J2X16_001979 [Pelomonas aquatica]|uniref:Ribbon-helix-helix protein CopG domain-containing protein n=1 Tax=Pelomonas aquatica TaxID=431058 RepID=A0ABU1Z7M7_9BURK|nr:hypothetical protein [Pelomonas aquatica]MDR7296632.1 hypothetical protein [Pelomonas aquatica]